MGETKRGKYKGSILIGSHFKKNSIDGHLSRMARVTPVKNLGRGKVRPLLVKGESEYKRDKRGEEGPRLLREKRVTVRGDSPKRPKPSIQLTLHKKLSGPLKEEKRGGGEKKKSAAQKLRIDKLLPTVDIVCPGLRQQRRWSGEGRGETRNDKR